MRDPRIVSIYLAKPMLLEARNLHIGYGDASAVWDVSLDVAAGEIVSVIGPNGAGRRP